MWYLDYERTRSDNEEQTLENLRARTNNAIKKLAKCDDLIAASIGKVYIGANCEAILPGITFNETVAPVVRNAHKGKYLSVFTIEKAGNAAWLHLNDVKTAKMYTTIRSHSDFSTRFIPEFAALSLSLFRTVGSDC